MTAVLRFSFVSENSDLNRGSYRIWIHDLSITLRELGHEVRIVPPEDVEHSLSDTDVFIFDKNLGRHVETVSPHFPGMVGIVNPSAATNYRVDFVIAGSVEEQISYKTYRHVFVLPLIERRFHEAAPRVHVDGESLTIGYHGNRLHLSSFKSLGLSAAIEDFARHLESRGKRLKLVIVSNVALERDAGWKPPDVNVEYRRYESTRIVEQLGDVDIGVVPNAYLLTPNPLFSVLNRKLRNRDMHASDFLLRMKNKSNFGRLLVFMQLGIPAIADLTPSHAQLIPSAEYGCLASTRYSWFDALARLERGTERQIVGDKARSYVREMFSPELWGVRFVNYLEALRVEQRQRVLMPASPAAPPTRSLAIFSYLQARMAAEGESDR